MSKKYLVLLFTAVFMPCTITIAQSVVIKSLKLGGVKIDSIETGGAPTGQSIKLITDYAVNQLVGNNTSNQILYNGLGSIGDVSATWNIDETGFINGSQIQIGANNQAPGAGIRTSNNQYVDIGDWNDWQNGTIMRTDTWAQYISLYNYNAFADGNGTWALNPDGTAGFLNGGINLYNDKSDSGLELMQQALGYRAGQTPIRPKRIGYKQIEGNDGDPTSPTWWVGAGGDALFSQVMAQNFLSLYDASGDEWSSIAKQGPYWALTDGITNKIIYLSTELLNNNAVVKIPNVPSSTLTGLSDNTTAPNSSTDTGFKGEVRIVGNYRYECIADNQWVRMAIDTSF